MAKKRHRPQYVRPLESPLVACLLSELGPIPGAQDRPAHVFRVRVWEPANTCWTARRERAIASRQRRKRRETGCVTARLPAVLNRVLQRLYLHNPARWRAVLRDSRNASVIQDFAVVDI